MLKQQITGRGNRVYQQQQAPLGRVKSGGKSVSRVTGSHCIGNKNILQCVGRKLQAPERCQTGVNGLYHRKCFLPVGRGCDGATTNPRLPVVDLAKISGTLTCPPTFRVPGTPKCRKSLSMIDLSPSGIDHGIGDLRSESSTSSLRLGEAIGDRTMSNNTSNSANSVEFLEERRDAKVVERAASTICHMLAINAWRRRREEVGSLQETVEEFGQKVDHLHIQIVVLRRLLHTENCRVEKLGHETHQLKNQLEESLQERDCLKKEKEKLEDQLEHLRSDSQDKFVATENLKNELMSLKNQLQGLETQISRDREKLLKLREDKKILLEKVTTAEAIAGERGVRAEKAEATIEEMQSKLDAQGGVIDQLQQDNKSSSRELTASETEKSRLEKRLRVSEDVGRALGLKAANLESQLRDKGDALRILEAAYNTQLTELKEFRERMIRQSQEVGWSGRMLQIAGSVVWAPRAILRSLAFLSNTGAH